MNQIIRILIGLALAACASGASAAFRSSANSSGDANAITVTAPAGVADNDVLLAYCAHDGAPTDTITFPAGWTLLDSAGQAAPDGQNAQLFWKLAASEPASYSVTYSRSGRQIACTVGAWSGRDTTPVFSFHTITQETTGSASPLSISSSTGTASSGDDIAFWIDPDAVTSGDWSLTQPAGYTNQGENNLATYGNLALATKNNVGAGAVGSLTATYTNGAITSGWTTVVVAIKAAAVASTGSRRSLAGVGQ